IKKIAGMYIMMTKRGPFFFADTTGNIRPSAEDLVDITIQTAEEVKKFNIEPRIALISYSNFGSSEGDNAIRVRKAVEILHREYPNLIVDGEMQANFALNKEIRQSRFPFSKLGNKDVNTLIFPNLSSGNIAYKMMSEIGGAEAIGPILLGMNKPIHILQIECSVREIVDMVTIAVVDAQNVKKEIKV
ncbi:MAG: NADP-dependent malic enzyme, partial [Bacteroidetes bacterium]|nr:NADP-dependent malic enzyme [Bacteroidota bacterium]